MKIFEKILGGNILYYPGCLTKFVAKDLKQRYEKLLRELGIDFIELLESELCCGSPALKAGYFDDFKNLAEKNLRVFKEHSVKKIITNCPACFMILRKEYPKVLGKKWNIKVEHITQTIIKGQKHAPYRNEVFGAASEVRTRKSEKVVYHDPCHLGRQMGIFEEPREIIKSLGYEISEMALSKTESFCCGGGGGTKSNEAELANKIAKDRISQAKKTGAEILCTACPLCYLHLKENSEDLKVTELSELFKENGHK